MKLEKFLWINCKEIWILLKIGQKKVNKKKHIFSIIIIIFIIIKVNKTGKKIKKLEKKEKKLIKSFNKR